MGSLQYSWQAGVFRVTPVGRDLLRSSSPALAQSRVGKLLEGGRNNVAQGGSRNQFCLDVPTETPF